MSKKLKNMKWASVPLEGFPISSEDFHGFVGLEECTDYGFDKESKKQNKVRTSYLLIVNVKYLS